LCQFTWLQFFHINIRSSNKNFNELIIYLENFNLKFDCIILSEIWCSFTFSTDKLLVGHDYFFTLNESNKAGGVIIFIRSCYKPTNINLSQFKTDDNSDFIGITFKTGIAAFNVIALYNHNKNTITNFTNLLINFKTFFSNTYRTLVIGDFNVNT